MIHRFSRSLIVLAPLRLVLSVTVAATAVLLSGCAGPSPHYAPSIDNVELLKKSGAQPARVGAFDVAPGLPGATALSLRANTMVSSVGGHFGDYLAAALRSELELARLYNPQSGTDVSGTLLKNNIDAGGLSTNNGQIEARFVVRRGGQVRFDKNKAIAHEWPGAFMGADAIPAAANNYPVMVRKLIAALIADPEFINALKN